MNRRERALRQRRRRVFCVAAGFVLLFSLTLFFLFRKKDGGTDSLLLCPYQYENETLNFSGPNARKPLGFAASLGTVPDESVYYDTSIATGAAIMVNVDTQEVLHSEGAFLQMAPASTTKLMTLLVTLRNGNLDDMVTVPEEAVRVLDGTGSSLAYIHAGDRISLRDLCYGLMLKSGNDAANAIACHVAGSIEAFTELMNQTAVEIGATNSHFMNPHGLDAEGHYTTAYDLYLIFNALLPYDEFRTMINTREYTASYLDAAGSPTSNTWGNSNGFISGEFGAPAGVTVIGGKTGTTDNAMYCLTLSSQGPNGDTYISVVLRSASRPKLYENMTNLLVKIPN
ncbi:MAG: D-alanyl-D-alanine carboxypeptidase [Lachnospiraceae bacterium]|nr:D-alanyl-D-alanine carboxypeptidase [Lachnospiraceae bacterium]